MRGALKAIYFNEKTTSERSSKPSEVLSREHTSCLQEEGRSLSALFELQMTALVKGVGPDPRCSCLFAAAAAAAVAGTAGLMGTSGHDVREIAFRCSIIGSILVLAFR